MADPFAWVSDHRTSIQRLIERHGAVLFRNFGVHSVSDFRRLIDPMIGEVMRHGEMVAGRQEVGQGVYTPTKYPSTQHIAPHNEHSASLTFPGKLAFWCKMPAESGGETPIADTRRIYSRIDPEVREKFERLGWMWVRNYHDLPGRRWQAVFQTESQSEVEAYCDRNQIEWEWRANGELRTRRIRPAVIEHPLTRERSWFNHITFFHITTLSDDIQAMLRATYGTAENFPNNTYYGDGSPIEEHTLRELRLVYASETVSFRWRQGDALLIDNILMAHARNPYSGPREILLILADPVARQDVKK
jgi:alpha-ketoglutarate-dependent taurine dioxygenase